MWCTCHGATRNGLCYWGRMHARYCSWSGSTPPRMASISMRMVLFSALYECCARHVPCVLTRERLGGLLVRGQGGEHVLLSPGHVTMTTDPSGTQTPHRSARAGQASGEPRQAAMVRPHICDVRPRTTGSELGFSLAFCSWVTACVVVARALRNVRDTPQAATPRGSAQHWATPRAPWPGQAAPRRAVNRKLILCLSPCVSA